MIFETGHIFIEKDDIPNFSSLSDEAKENHLKILPLKDFLLLFFGPNFFHLELERIFKSV